MASGLRHVLALRRMSGHGLHSGPMATVPSRGELQIHDELGIDRHQLDALRAFRRDRGGLRGAIRQRRPRQPTANIEPWLRGGV